MAASSKQPFELSDFSGGITDNIFGAPANTAYQMDNFVVTPEKKLYSRDGSVVDDPAHSPIPLGNARIGLLVNYAKDDKLFAQSGKDFFYRSGNATGAWAKATGPTGNSVLNQGTSANYVSTAEWNRQLFVVGDAFSKPMKIFKDQSGQYQVRNVGLPAFSSNLTWDFTFGNGTTTGGTHSYLYAFVYTYVYGVATQTFEEIGPTAIEQPTSSVPVVIDPTTGQLTYGHMTLYPVGPVINDGSGNPKTRPITINNITPLTPASDDNYDLSNIKLEIYRTIDNGTNFYRVAQLPATTTTYTDTTLDSDLQDGVQLYTNDGTLDYTQAPPAKYMHVVGNVGLYGYTKDSDGEHPYRLHQSIPGNPGFVPQITWVEVEEEVRGVSSVKGLPILLCKRRVYRVDGTYLSSGQGGMNPVEIHHAAGCVSHQSCVEAENWLFWAGNDGFYATDGYQVLKISDQLNERYQAMLKATPNTARIQGKFDTANRRVIWTVTQTLGNTDQDSIFALDLRWGVTSTSTFTTYSGKSFKPTAVEIFNNALYRGDNNGFVFQHGPDFVTDPRVDVSASASSWAEEAIIWNLTTNQFNFGSSFFRKFVSRILLQAENAGNTTIQITAINDQGKRTRELKPIRWRRNITWGDQAVSWGNQDCIWAADGVIEQWRRFPAGGLRLSYLQLIFTNGLGIIANSDDEGVCTLNQGTKTVVLPTLWPADSVDYFIAFANDGYARQFQVQAINGTTDTLTLLDPAGKLPASGVYEWELMGYSKGERLNLIGYNLYWDNVDQNQGTFRPGDTGAN